MTCNGGEPCWIKWLRGLCLRPLLPKHNLYYKAPPVIIKPLPSFFDPADRLTDARPTEQRSALSPMDRMDAKWTERAISGPEFARARGQTANARRVEFPMSLT